MLKSLGGVFGGSGGAASGLVGVLGTAVPMAGFALIGLKYGKQIWAGMRKAFGAIGGFFKNIFGNVAGAIGGLFGAGKKATIESAWDPRILKELFDSGFRVGDKVSKEHAKDIAAKVGAGQGLKDGFSFRDLKGNEEKRDRRRTNQEALEASIKEAKRAGVVLTQAEIDRILGVQKKEEEAVTEVRDAEIDAALEVKEVQITANQELLAAATMNATELHDLKKTNIAELQTKLTENAQAYHDKLMADHKGLFELQVRNEYGLNGMVIVNGLKKQNEIAYHRLRMDNEKSLHQKYLEGAGKIITVADGLIQRFNEMSNKAASDSTNSLADLLEGAFGDAVMSEIGRRSLRGDPLIYSSGVVDSGRG